MDPQKPTESSQLGEEAERREGVGPSLWPPLLVAQGPASLPGLLVSCYLRDDDLGASILASE